MKIIIYGINYAPELTGIGKYNGEMAEWLVSRDHELLVITAPPYYPEWKVRDGYSSWRYKYENLNGVNVIRCPVWVPKKASGLRRVIHLASFALSSAPVIFYKAFWKPQIIISIEPPLFVAPLTLLASWISKAHSCLHVQDFEVDAAFELRFFTSKKIKKKVLSIESWLMKRFNRVSTISSNMMVKLHSKGLNPEKTFLLPNWVDVDSIFPIESPNYFRQKLNISDSKIIFLYSGNMGEKQGLEILIEAARMLRDKEEILFVMCGQGAAYERLQQDSNGLGNIYWLPLQPIEKLNDLLNMADVHLLPQRADATDLVMPSKLTGMMASGRPILATVDKKSQVASVLSESGMITPPGDLDSFINGIKYLASNVDQRNFLGVRARSYAEKNLSKSTILSNAEKEFMDLMCDKRI